ncbi:MAG TPA: NAD(P)/FAD-dependent oxidoreductase [Nitrospirales bacterium]|jgi:thioredoxin reductase (NADPH)
MADTTQDRPNGPQAAWEVIVVGGGLAGLSAALYLGRSKRRTLVIESGHSMAVWEQDVENYLGFPDGISGEDLLHRGRQQAERYDVQFIRDEIMSAERAGNTFVLQGRHDRYQARRLVLATGITHLPPEIPEVRVCLGRSLFFCKDCDGYRVQGTRIGIIGHTNEAIDYALGMLVYSPTVIVATNGGKKAWDRSRADWIEEYRIPVYEERIVEVEHDHGMVCSIRLKDGPQVAIDYLFATRGDLCHNQLAQSLGANLNTEGEIDVDECMLTSVRGLYAAGCVTPANCQMIIAAGQGATAAQAINRDLFEEDLRTQALRRYREGQIRHAKTEPEILKSQS